MEINYQRKSSCQHIFPFYLMRKYTNPQKGNKLQNPNEEGRINYKYQLP